MIATADLLWALQETLRAEVIPGCRPLKSTPRSLDRVCKLIAEGVTEDDAKAVLMRIAADVKADPSCAKWFNGETNWRPANFDRNLGSIGSPGASEAKSKQPEPPPRRLL